jgi:TatD DNase family protein
MIDCHAHLALDDFDADRSAVLLRAAEAGVHRILVVAEDLADSRRVLAVCKRHSDLLRPCIGLHPDRFGDDRIVPDEREIDALCDLARQQREVLAAVGEVGLDYWRARKGARRTLQRRCFRRMIALAGELGLPLNVHSRSAGRHTLELLAAEGAATVLLHAFDGKAGHARQAAERHGWLFSIPPSVVRSRQKQRLARHLPLKHLALESDSPVLGPDPRQRNEPANLTHTVAYLAQVKSTSRERVIAVTTDNARRLFG